MAAGRAQRPFPAKIRKVLSRLHDSDCPQQDLLPLGFYFHGQQSAPKKRCLASTADESNPGNRLFLHQEMRAIVARHPKLDATKWPKQ